MRLCGIHSLENAEMIEWLKTREEAEADIAEVRDDEENEALVRFHHDEDGLGTVLVFCLRGRAHAPFSQTVLGPAA